MDAFYASVEQRDHPEYRGKPIAVGGSPQGRGGVVATASYEARRFGVRSAMASKIAIQRCPELIFVRPRFEVYKEVSSKIREIFRRYTDLIEPLSLDEAFLDVSEDKLGIGSAIEIATLIKKAIRDELHLTASAGVSVNKFIAKIASDMKKPDGLTFIGPSKIQKFMESLPVEKFFGVGKVTASRMNRLGLFTGGDLKKLQEDELVKHFGKSGKFFFKIVRGIDEREVQPFRETKSVGAEDTFPVDLKNTDEMVEELARLAPIVANRLRKHNLRGRTVTVKVKFSDFRQITRSVTLPHAIQEEGQIFATAKSLLVNMEEDVRVRLLGITLSNFEDPNGGLVAHSDQLPLEL